MAPHLGGAPCLGILAGVAAWPLVVDTDRDGLSGLFSRTERAQQNWPGPDLLGGRRLVANCASSGLASCGRISGLCRVQWDLAGIRERVAWRGSWCHECVARCYELRRPAGDDEYSTTSDHSLGGL